MSRAVIVIGAGGHGKVVADTLLAGGVEVLGFADPDPEKKGTSVLGLPVLGGDDAVEGFSPTEVDLANGIGSVATLTVRRAVFERFRDAGYQFATVRHPSACVSDRAVLGMGAQVLAGAVVQVGATIGVNTIINTRASVDHDCWIGDHVHIGPGATLSGTVSIGDETHVGTGAALIQGVTLGAGTFVAAGAVVTSDFPSGARLIGVPARQRDRR